jgi:hypothetical protein
MNKNISLFLIMLVLVGYVHANRAKVLPQLVFPTIIDTDGERLFVLDGVTVYVYEIKDFQLVTTFGKLGEGPGELQVQPDLPACMQVFGDKVILNSYNKMIFYTKQGQLINEKKIPFLVSQIIPLRENFVATKFSRGGDGSSIMSVLLLDEKLKEIKEIYKTELLNDQGRGKIAWPLMFIQIQTYGDQLFVFDQHKGFHIDIFNSQIIKVKEIKKEYEKIKITDAYKKEKLAWFKLQPALKNAPEEIREMIYFLDYLPVVSYCLVRDDKIYIQTNRTKSTQVEFFILNFSGTVLKQIFLPNALPESIRLSPAALYTIKNDKYFYLDENQDEEWELHIIDLK